jgi:hypothetical protein
VTEIDENGDEYYWEETSDDEDDEASEASEAESE